MEIPKTLLSQGERRPQPSSPDLPQKTSSDFLRVYSPQAQLSLATSDENAFFGDFPTLSQIGRTYGSRFPQMWLIPQLYNLSEYCGVKDKLRGAPLEECAAIISTEFYYLKISELMLFFYRFKSGRYGRFYGTVDPMIILESIREFLKERGMRIEQHDREMERAKREEWARNAVPMPESIKQYLENL